MAKRALRNNPRDTANPPVKRRKLSQGTIKEEVKVEDMKQDHDSDIDNKTEYDIEKIRLKNIQDNAAFLQDLGLHKELLSFTKPKSRPSQNGLKERREKVILPPRKSLRLQRMDPGGGLLPELPATPVFDDNEPDNPRLPEGPLPMTENLNNDFEDKEIVCKNFHNKLAGLRGDASIKNSVDLERFLKSLDKMNITEDRVAKVVPQRIFSVAVHPDQKCVLAVAGDKWGRIGFWDVGSKAGQDGVFCYRPHCRPVSCLSFHSANPSRLFSCSYDGTLRCADFEKAVFDEVYTTPEDDQIRLNSFAFTSPDTLLVTNSEGEVVQIDSRSNKHGAEHTWSVDTKSLKCVSVHPTKSNYFVTAGNSGAVNIYDLRNIGKKPKAVAELRHWKSVDSAYFSPVTGRFILSTGMDDSIRVSDWEPNRKDAWSNVMVKHDNHTGRWLSNFKAVWHPQREDTFIVGSMARPRRIELFSNRCKMVKTFEDNMECLASVCSLNAFHPTRNILVGGNSSGRLHVFMD